MTQIIPFSTNSSLPLPDVFSSALVGIFEDAKPAIVQVHTEGRGGGTGIIIDNDGRMLTNNHVVARDDAKVEVLLADGRSFPAVVLQRNPRLDLALLKIDGDDLKTLSIGDSTKLRVGEWVFAIGHPWGQRWVVTAGIVSSIRTAKLADDLTTHYIQSDVGLAPGNSGGPLLNADGQVVGINAMIFGGDLSVAIPGSVVSDWLSELPARRVTLGIEILTMELPESMRALASQASGVMVVGIRPERQEKYSDLFIGDILLEVAGKAVKNNAALLETLADGQERERLPVKLLRGGELVQTEIATLLLERKVK
ncbi:MAG TPA: trypsin-like peptidase domain-containing protein [Ktedonobacteraceae bacterium]|nr:trypsin-like peptidase domain-containing protein [Ktedonobacteraceae bacterium]